MSTVPIPQGATVDQEPVAIPQGATVDAAPPGQKPLDPSRPGLGSTDDQGNIYFQGQKVEVNDTPLTPTVGALGALKGAATAINESRAGIAAGKAIGTAAGTAIRLARTPAGQLAIKGAMKAAEYSLGIKLADLWRGL